MPITYPNRLIIYELYIDKFANNLAGLTKNLPYIKQLGCNAIWLLPHYPSPMVDEGYDVSDYVNVRSELGSLKDFEHMCAEASKLGLRVIIDLVINHTSTEHTWFREARSNTTNNKRGYYLWSKNGDDMLASLNAFPNIKLTNWVYNPFTNDYYFATFYPLQPDLNWDNPEVLDEFTNIMAFWANLGVTGFRLDALTHITKRNHSLSLALPETHTVTKAFRTFLQSKYSNMLLIGEADLNCAHARDYFGDGDECTHLFNFEDSARLWECVASTKPELLAKIKENAIETSNMASWIYFLGTHDTLPIKLLGYREQEKLEAFLDPKELFKHRHDKRIAIRMGEVLKDRDSLIKAFKLLASAPGSVVIYYGDELGLGNFHTNEFLIDNRQQVRNPFDWEEAKKQIKDPESLYNNVSKLFVA